MPDASRQDFWKRKLLAFLHDPPCKALNIRDHEKISMSFQRAALPGVDENWLRETARAIKDSDWIASAADRFCFPRGKAPAKFTGQRGATFRHPLGSGEFVMKKLPSVELAEGILQDSFGGIRVDEQAREGDQWRQRFFLYWRRWLEQSVLSDNEPSHASNLAFYPADTRIPDHTVWCHMGLTSALEACRQNNEIRPAFLVFQVGPVQEFIAQARSTRDLWSGSYLLAWLTAHAIKAVTDRLGPDNIIFPAIRGQGIFDVLHRDQIYSKIFYRAGEYDPEEEHSLWRRMYSDGSREDKERVAQRLLTPSLPNRFVALVPENSHECYGDLAEQALRAALAAVSEASWRVFAGLVGDDVKENHLENMHARWQTQVEALPEVSWVEVPWKHSIDEALDDFRKLPINKLQGQTENGKRETEETGRWTPARILDMNNELAKRVEKTGSLRRNSGLLWSLNYHRAEFALAARRNTRNFGQSANAGDQTAAPKDALTGKEEIIGDEDLWGNLRSIENGPFKSSEGPYGAVTLMKRLWWRKEAEFLSDRLGIEDGIRMKTMGIDSTADVAACNKNHDERRAGKSTRLDSYGERKPNDPYVAVIAMDGDEMGKRISGEKNPALLAQVAQAAVPFLKQDLEVPEGLPRALTPSYHMQFSEALTNFATYLADPIVRKHDGVLIYAGGDDVLAMVPATEAVHCAMALRGFFRGVAADLPQAQRKYNLGTVQDGFVCADKAHQLVVPGPNTELSCGIAVAHYQHPLQAIVREAQAAEGRAKGAIEDGGLDRGAFAISLLKRGGETIHWGAKWEYEKEPEHRPEDRTTGVYGALDLYHDFCRLRREKKLSGRFPYALAQLLKPYRLGEPPEELPESHEAFDPDKTIRAELEHVLNRQGDWESEDDRDREEFRTLCHQYLDSLSRHRKDDFVKLFMTATFIERDRAEKKEGNDDDAS